MEDKKMDNNIKKILGFFLVSAVLVTSAIAAANEYAYSNVAFTIPTDTSFLVTVVGSAGNYSEAAAPGNKTLDIWFNSSDGNSKNVHPCLGTDGLTCQTGANPILTFKNLGTTNMNWTVLWNQSLPSGIKVWANVTFAAGSCAIPASCILGANGTQFTTTNWEIAGNFTPNNESELWLQANFTNVGAGTYWRALNYTSWVSGI